MDIHPVKDNIKKIFLKKSEEIISNNENALGEGYYLAQKECGEICYWKLPRRDDEHYIITGNEALALGAAYGGCRFISAYPMSPSTGIITYLASVQERLGIFTEQAEDEIAAINMASGIFPRLWPGMSRHLVAADSDEHDEWGHITEDLAATAPAMVKKRISKLNGLKGAVQPPEEISLEKTDVVFIGWGSTRGALIEASDLFKHDGINAGIIHFTELWPLPEYDFPKDKTYWDVEGNALGQLSRLLKDEYDINFKGLISRYDGLPITGEYIRRCFYEQS